MSATKPRLVFLPVSRCIHCGAHQVVGFRASLARAGCTGCGGTGFRLVPMGEPDMDEAEAAP